MLDRMKKARAGLIAAEPFFGSLAMKFDLVEDAKAKSTWTDGKRLGFNPEWVQNTPMPEVEATFAHHVLSCAWGHHLRRGERKRDLWQEASDYVVNLELQRAGFQLPQGSLVDQRFDKMTVEQAYRTLDQKPEEDDNDGDGQGDGSGSGSGSGASDDAGSSQGDAGAEGDADAQGDAGGSQDGAPTQPENGSGGAGDAATGTVEDATDDAGQAADDAQKAEQAADWKEAAAQAAQVARGAGRLPGGIERGVEDFLTSKVDWREALQRLLKSHAKEDSSWLVRSRRSPDGFFLPGRKSEACGTLVFAIDISGSIGQHQIDQFVSEIEEARLTMRPERIVAYMFDTQVRQRFEFEQDEPITGIRSMGGGGTAFDDPIYEVEREGFTPEAFVFLTDLDSGVFASEPAFPVIWVSTMKDAAPYGDVIKMEE